jgi:ATP-dependent Lhr-like helicase
MVGEKDALDEEELRRQRVRLLLDRYGILFRELLAGELAVFQWSRLFRTLRLMELSGEVLAGHFFTGVPGLQFISHEAFRRLQEELPGHAVYWLGAQDPISPCGLDLPAFKGLFPARRRGAFVVFRGETPVVLAEGHGRRLDIRVPADDPALAEMLGFLQVLLSREVQPMKALDVEEINGLGALESPYGGLLKELFSATRERKGWRLRKSYSGGKA